MSFANQPLRSLVSSTSTACYLCARHAATIEASVLATTTSWPVKTAKRSLASTSCLNTSRNDSLEDLVSSAKVAEERRTARRAWQDSRYVGVGHAVWHTLLTQFLLQACIVSRSSEASLAATQRGHESCISRGLEPTKENRSQRNANDAAAPGHVIH